MKDMNCREFQAAVRAGRAGQDIEDHELHRARQHLARCDSCRRKAYEQGFLQLLDRAYGEKPPEPTPAFHAALRTRLAAQECESAEDALQVLLPRLGVRLVPALAALVLFAAGAAGFMLRSPAEARSAALDELVFFSDSQLSSDAVAAAIFQDEEAS